MSEYLYKTVPMRRTLAPKRRRNQSAEEAIADAVGALLEEHAQEGWEFYRSDVFVAPAKTGWLSREQNAEFNILTFRKARDVAAIGDNDAGVAVLAAEYPYSDPYVDATLRRAAVPGSAAGAPVSGGAAAGSALRRRAPYPPTHDIEPEEESSAPAATAPPAPRRGAPKPRGAAAPPPPQQPFAPPPGKHTRAADKLRRRTHGTRDKTPAASDVEAVAPKVGRLVVDDTISLSGSMRAPADRD